MSDKKFSQIRKRTNIILSITGILFSCIRVQSRRLKTAMNSGTWSSMNESFKGKLAENEGVATRFLCRNDIHKLSQGYTMTLLIIKHVECPVDVV